MLHEMLSRLATEYTFERAKSYSESEFGKFVRHDIAIEARKSLLFLPFELKVKASVGAGVWAAVPWLGFFDPLITESAQSGFYVVYLINPDSNDIYLSMNQGTTSVYEEFGETRGIEVLKRRAIDMHERILPFAKGFSNEPINLGSETRLPKGYEAGHAFGKKYRANEIDQNQFYLDLTNMLVAYEKLIDLGGTTPSDAMQEETGGTNVEEVRRYFLSRRIERAPNVRPRVIEKRGMICEGCGLDPEKHYGYNGRPEKTPLDVHHKTPLFQLAEGESKRYKIPDDFLVLCPNCHRIIHMQDNPSDLQLLRESIRFKYSSTKS